MPYKQVEMSFNYGGTHMAESVHLDRELMRAVLRGELPVSLLRRIGLDHLLDVCPHCRREVEALHRELSGDVYSTKVVLQELLKKQIPHLKREHRLAQHDLTELLTFPAEERIVKVERSRRRFRSGHLVQLLLDACEHRFTTDPPQARHLAELARAVIKHSPITSDVYYDLMALSGAYLANAWRAGGDLREADEQFRQVQELVSRSAVSDPEILARVADLESSLRKDQRRFSHARRLLIRSITLYRLTATREIPRILLKFGDLFYAQGLLQKAIEATQAALDQLPADPSSRLYMMGRYNLALQLADAGRPQEAAAYVAEDEELYRQHPEPWVQLRLLCLRAKIAAGFGELDLALDLLARSRAGFIGQGIGYDADMVSREMEQICRRMSTARPWPP
jgi:tetratricopeptide (TPR) repeat protein